MRRLYVSLVLAGLFQMLSPAPAQAWWEWLDELSGPKGLKGPQFEARLACFGNELPAGFVESLSEAAARWQMPSGSTDCCWEAAVRSWKIAEAAWNGTAVALSAGSPKTFGMRAPRPRGPPAARERTKPEAGSRDKQRREGRQQHGDLDELRRGAVVILLADQNAPRVHRSRNYRPADRG